MFEELYKYPAIIAEHRRKPLAKERQRFLNHLATRGYPRKTLMQMASGLFTIVEVLKLRPDRSVTLEQIKRAAGRFRTTTPGGRCGKREKFIAAAKHWLRFMGLLQQNKGKLIYAPMIERFLAWMKDERGLSTATIRMRHWHLVHFFRWYEARRKSLSAIKPGDIDKFLQWSAVQGWGRRSIGVRAHALRAFLKYAGRMGWCSLSVAATVRGLRIFAQEDLPAGPSWEDVGRLLAQMDTNEPCDVRDRAIILLLAVYGLRIGEVADLSLDDIVWEHDTIIIRGNKTGKVRMYPLVSIVGQAIIRYLREVRPRSAYRKVFLTLRAPVGPTRYLASHVRQRILASGIPTPHHGPHSLRHACATHLLAEGFSLKAISDHLGHASLQSTRTYAKVDLAGLNEVAAFDLGGLA